MEALANINVELTSAEKFSKFLLKNCYKKGLPTGLDMNMVFNKGKATDIF
jgi:hypothetical protein